MTKKFKLRHYRPSRSGVRPGRSPPGVTNLRGGSRRLPDRGDRRAQPAHGVSPTDFGCFGRGWNNKPEAPHIREIVTPASRGKHPVPEPDVGALTRSADLVVNTGSMQEMTDEWIDFLFGMVGQVRYAIFFYSLNYIAQPIAVMGESRNLWSQRLGAEWSTRHHRLNIPLLDLEGPTRDFLEALYEKSPAT